MVLEDVLDEYVSLENARSQYGVVIDPGPMTVDLNGTQALREKMRANGG
jgi:N-methylhydantoinase B